MFHLIKHDLVHGLWHFDRGLLYTLRGAFLRSGHMAMDYIKGKRVKYYSFFYLILLVLGINLLTALYFKAHYHITNETAPEGLQAHLFFVCCNGICLAALYNITYNCCTYRQNIYYPDLVSNIQ